MSKKIKTMKWQSVALEGLPIANSDKFEGFVGLEECTDYGMDKGNKTPKKKKPAKKRKASENKNIEKENAVPNKKIKLSNGFMVESCEAVTPSLTNDAEKPKKKNKRRKNKKNKKKTDDEAKQKPDIKPKDNNKKQKVKLGETQNESKNTLTAEDMLSWAEFKLPEEIIKALMELGFKQPTKIQQLSLPAAIHGRRDILGAAETGSGKTLAFGLPILTGILKLKEKAALKNLDVYDIPFRKPSVKKQAKPEESKVKKNKRSKKKNLQEKENKESSEDGYGSGPDSNEDSAENDPPNESNDVTNDDNDSDDAINDATDDENDSGDENDDSEADNDSNDDFLEEIDVPLRKREESADEGNDSDSEYVHLSEMLDSDDTASSDGDDDDEDERLSIDEQDGVDEVDAERTGIGCVKVLDDINISSQTIVKTGKPLYALILTPTRELAIQISRHLIAVAKYTGIKVATIVGGMAAVKQERVLRSGPEIVVATPGRLWELVNQGEPHLQQLASVKFLAIDETDRMIERGHFEELEPLLERLNIDETHKNSRQNFVFSATLTLIHDLPSHMKGKKVTKRGKIINRKVEKMTSQQKIKRLVTMVGMSDPKVVDITTQNFGTAETLTECRIACSLDQKDAYVYYILKRHPGRTIVFCNSINSVKRLAQILSLLKCRPLPLHASMQQRQRLKNLERFRDDSQGVLIATDVAARGLDIPNVDHVIHYQVPKTAENYVHRSGRTARANKEGLTILMMEPAEAYNYAKLCRTLNKTSEIPSFPVPSDHISVLKDMINLAREIETLELRRRRISAAVGWREKVANEMDMIVDDDDVPQTKMDPGLDKALNAKKKQLDALMSRPIFPKGFSFKYPTLNDPNALEPVSEENALQVMKKALQTGVLKKNKRKGKNQSLLQLEKEFKNK
ncbi:DEAD-box ATP-dependent RNA helicase 13 [Colias croceus]|uniref:DEAD-box ATP-dependent RNA helicase 13 n=1 Tax=Colias crocea TaxID=72248 RepID=UPI001E27DE27|nr:DEAD-box ATP-dependent RNA helicase 13 [Colias croceus]